MVNINSGVVLTNSVAPITACAERKPLLMTMTMMTMMVHGMNCCRLANIPCILVQGIAKGYRHDPEDVYTASSKTNHAWNLVLIKGEWRPLDTTWGAGHLDMGGNFNRKFEEHWFLTDPEEFVPRHFPLVDGCVDGRVRGCSDGRVYWWTGAWVR